jgi:hypothetical protein
VKERSLPGALDEDHGRGRRLGRLDHEGKIDTRAFQLSARLLAESVTAQPANQPGGNSERRQGKGRIRAVAAQFLL